MGSGPKEVREWRFSRGQGLGTPLVTEGRGPDLLSMSISSAETGGGADVTHTITICFEGSCPGTGSQAIVELGDAEVKIQSDGPSSARVYKKPKGGSYGSYTLVNWDSDDDKCCITFTCTESEMGNPGGLPGPGQHDFEFSAECPGGDRMPDTGAGTHGW